MVDRNFKTNPVTTEELINCTWYAVPNDLIGGWDLSNVNKPESQRQPFDGEFEIGTFMTQEVAEHIAKVHNTWWEIEVWKTYMINIRVAQENKIRQSVKDLNNVWARTLDKLKKVD